MRLAQKARGLVRAVKDNTTQRVRRAKSTRREDAVPQEKYIREGDQLASVKEQSRPRTRSVTSGATATTAATGTLGKRPRAMGHNAVTIHEDAQDHQNYPRKLRKMSATDRMQVVSDDEEWDEENDGSSDSEDEVDESVMDDMRRLEENFNGISQKYRLINRIGEGQCVWWLSWHSV